jgi:hypothetical protein
MASLNFTLYLNRSFPRSLWTDDIRDLTRLCQELAGDYSIDIVDAADAPRRGFHDGVLSTPAVLLAMPDGSKQTLGTLAETEKFLRLRQRPTTRESAQPCSWFAMHPAWKTAP